MRGRIVALRTELTAGGLDAVPVTIAWHLGQEGLAIPSTSTIRRILHAAGLVVPEPRKRPRSSWIRFEASAPNELWQSDVTHWRLADGTEVETISWRARRDSNPRPSDPKSDALSTELRARDRQRSADGRRPPRRPSRRPRPHWRTLVRNRT